MAETNAKARTRARILDEAAKAMREQGTEGVGVAALMKRAGLTHGGFYAHFENRDDLVAHAVERMFEDSGRVLRSRLTHADPAEGLRALIDWYLSEEMRRSPDRGCPAPGLGGEVSRMPPAAQARFKAGILAFRDTLAGALLAIGAPAPETLAGSVLAELIGAMTVARALNDPVESSAFLSAAREQLKSRLGL